MSAVDCVRAVLNNNPPVTFGASALVDGVLPVFEQVKPDMDGNAGDAVGADGVRMVGAIYGVGGSAPTLGFGGFPVLDYRDRVQIQVKVNRHRAKAAVDKLNEVRNRVAPVRGPGGPQQPVLPDGVAELRFINIETGPQLLYEGEDESLVYGLTLGVRWVPELEPKPVRPLEERSFGRGFDDAFG